MQRILKEHGIKSVQPCRPDFPVTLGAVEEAIGLSLQEPEEGETPTVDADDEDYETEEKEIDYRFVDTDDDGICRSPRPSRDLRKPTASVWSGYCRISSPAGNCWITR